MERIFRITGDGFPTFFVPSLNEHYHSVHGAYHESMHVFIEAGLNYFLSQHDRSPSILEVGFGTGLNAWLSLREAGKRKIPVHYTALEPFPVEPLSLLQLAEADLQNRELQFSDLETMHLSPFNTDVAITPFFTLHKLKTSIELLDAARTFDIVYFDAFGPQVQPEIWQTEIFRKLFNAMQNDAVLVTYSAKGAVRRSMQEVGFSVERIPGPKGKREMLRAIKL